MARGMNLERERLRQGDVRVTDDDCFASAAPYRTDLVASQLVDVVRFAGGRMCDRAMARQGGRRARSTWSALYASIAAQSARLSALREGLAPRRLERRCTHALYGGRGYSDVSHTIEYGTCSDCWRPLSAGLGHGHGQRHGICVERLFIPTWATAVGG
jgi:hypothetical protein